MNDQYRQLQNNIYEEFIIILHHAGYITHKNSIEESDVYRIQNNLSVTTMGVIKLQGDTIMLCRDPIRFDWIRIELSDYNIYNKILEFFNYTTKPITDFLTDLEELRGYQLTHKKKKNDHQQYHS